MDQYIHTSIYNICMNIYIKRTYNKYAFIAIIVELYMQCEHYVVSEVDDNKLYVTHSKIRSSTHGIRLQ